MTAYTDYVTFDEGVASRAFSFRTDHAQQMAYSDFLTRFKARPQHVSLKETRKEVTDRLLKDIVIPDFYKEIQALEKVELFQGAHFVEKPHYSRNEQLICAIHG